MRIWNYNENNFGPRGVRLATIKYAADGAVGNLSDPNDAGWQVFGQQLSLSRADMRGDFEGVDEFYLDVDARHVLLVVEQTYGDANYVGLSEVQLFQIPEPSSFLLAAMGLAGLAAFRWGRK